jgi:hypothetical protein
VIISLKILRILEGGHFLSSKSKPNPKILAGVASFTKEGSNNRASKAKQANDELIAALDKGCTIENAIKYALGKVSGSNMFKFHKALNAAGISCKYDERMPSIRELLRQQQLAAVAK